MIKFLKNITGFTTPLFGITWNNQSSKNDFLISNSDIDSNFFFNSVGVQNDPIATIFVCWCNLINSSSKGMTVLSVKLNVDNQLSDNCSKPKLLPYSNVTYIRSDLENNSGTYLEFDQVNYDFQFKPYIVDKNLFLKSGQAEGGSMIFWFPPMFDSLHSNVEGKVIVNTTVGNFEFPMNFPRKGV